MSYNTTTLTRSVPYDPNDEIALRHQSPEANGVSAASQVNSRPTLLVGEREHRMYLLDPEKIDYVAAHGNYVTYHAGSLGYISRDSIKRLSRLLARSGFLRIERRLLINVHSISYAQPSGRGTYTFTLLSGLRLRSGTSYRSEILRVLPLSPNRTARATSTG
jgi:DNA-binding LytR/AlgR family response regulator